MSDEVKVGDVWQCSGENTCTVKDIQLTVVTALWNNGSVSRKTKRKFIQNYTLIERDGKPVGQGPVEGVLAADVPTYNVKVTLPPAPCPVFIRDYEGNVDKDVHVTVGYSEGEEPDAGMLSREFNAASVTGEIYPRMSSSAYILDTIRPAKEAEGLAYIQRRLRSWPEGKKVTWTWEGRTAYAYWEDEG